MKLRQIYERGIKAAVEHDPRPRRMIKDALGKVKKEYGSLKGLERKYFDRDRLVHCYDDSRILYGTGNEDVKTVLVGIDIDVQEILLAQKLREKGVRVDLVIAHHPCGIGLMHLDKVMAIQPDLWKTLGFRPEIADSMMDERMKEVFRNVLTSNHTRAVDAAKLLGIPFMCMHTFADNCVTTYLQKLFDKEKPKKLANVLSILRAIPEYRDSMKIGAGPSIFIGDKNTDAGKIFVDMTGGTSGPDRVVPRLSQAGVKTVVGMHVKDSTYKNAKVEFLNYVIAGHISSDTLGLNLLFDSIDKKGELKFIECSGFRRITRR